MNSGSITETLKQMKHVHPRPEQNMPITDKASALHENDDNNDELEIYLEMRIMNNISLGVGIQM